MFGWIAENIATIIVLMVLILIVTLIIIKMVKNKKNGKSYCSGNCSCCSMSGNQCSNSKINNRK